MIPGSLFLFHEKESNVHPIKIAYLATVLNKTIEKN